MERLTDEVRKQVRQFDSCTQMNKNCIRFDTKSDMAHREVVNHICMDLMRKGKDFFTRARLKENELVADIYSIPDNTIIEVQCSESDESILRKKTMWEERGFNFMCEDTNIGGIF
jgi:hypothetical protein